MNPLDNYTERINYRNPVIFRRRRRNVHLGGYNDGSAEIAAMNSHLRAAAYGSRELAAATANNSACSLLNLSREYDSQARDNFAKEAIAFAVIAIVAVAWPFIHGMQVLAL